MVRAFGTTVLSLGTPLRGLRDGAAAEPLQMLSTRKRHHRCRVPAAASPRCSEALSWWTSHLSRFLAVVTDPTGFVGADQHYRPQRHLQSLASVDQVFRRVHSVQTAYRDGELRLVAFFSVLDTLQDLTGHDLVVLCRPASRAKSSRKSDRHDPGRSRVLLWGAERAVNALEELQDGFFLPRQAGLDITVPGGTALPLPDAVASTSCLAQRHSRLRRPTGRHGPPEALLASHTGRVPHDLPMVAYLYLLYMLTRPAPFAATPPAERPTRPKKTR